MLALYAASALAAPIEVLKSKDRAVRFVWKREQD
jgi:hypothetical protein